MKKLSGPIVAMLGLVLSLGILSCTNADNNNRINTKNDVESSSVSTLKDMIIFEEYLEESEVKIYVTPVSSIYGEIEEDLFYHDSVVYDNNIYLMGNKFKFIKAYSARESFIQRIKHDKDSSSSDPCIFSKSPIPHWLETSNSHKNISMTQDYFGNAYILRNNLIERKDGKHSVSISQQEISKISLKDDLLANTYKIESLESLNEVKCGIVEDKVFIVATNKKNPKTLVFSSLNESTKLCFNDLISFDRNISAWECVMDNLIIVFDDQSIQTHKIMLTGNNLTLSDPTVLKNIPTSEKDIFVRYNPVKECVFLWEALYNGGSWFYSELSPGKSWESIGDTSTCVLNRFVLNMKDEDNFESSIFPMGMKDPIILEGTKPWTQSPCFLYLTDSKTGFLQWKKVDYQNFME